MSRVEILDQLFRGNITHVAAFEQLEAVVADEKRQAAEQAVAQKTNLERWQVKDNAAPMPVATEPESQPEEFKTSGYNFGEYGA